MSGDVRFKPKCWQAWFLVKLLFLACLELPSSYVFSGLVPMERQYVLVSYKGAREFPGSQVAKTPHSQFRGSWLTVPPPANQGTRFHMLQLSSHAASKDPVCCH